ncbi:hypothetical protein HanPI659440_Chr10g0367271 [Helianthus annuus]|nr:hypothetical protein HanPI659440_Chr10g0367271 [Helianthus annuus]
MRIENPNQRPLATSSSNNMPILRQRKTRNPRIMSQNKLRFLQTIMLNTNLPLLQPGTHKYKITRPLRNLTQPLGIRKRFNLMQQLQIRKIIHKYLLLQHNNNPIPPQPNSPNLRPKRQLTDTPTLMIIPNHNLIWRILRFRTATN